MKTCPAAWLLALLLVPLAAHAHKQSDSYLTIAANNGSALQGQWDIALRDLNFAVGIDSNGDDLITWGEVRRRADAISAYAFEHLSLKAADAHTQVACVPTLQQLLIDDHVDGAYAVLKFSAPCAIAPRRLDVSYSLLFAVDPNHRGLLNIQ